MLNGIVNWFNTEFGDRAPMFAVILVLIFVLGLGLGYKFGRNFGVNDNGTQSSKVQRDRR